MNAFEVLGAWSVYIQLGRLSALAGISVSVYIQLGRLSALGDIRDVAHVQLGDKDNTKLLRFPAYGDRTCAAACR